MATIQENTMYGVSIQFKYKNASQWGNDEVLLAGEIGLELDTKKYKLGDGSTAWSELAYYSNPQVTALVDALTERVGTAESDIIGLRSDVDANTQDIAALKGITVISANPAPAVTPGE